MRCHAGANAHTKSFDGFLSDFIKNSIHGVFVTQAIDFLTEFITDIPSLF